MLNFNYLQLNAEVPLHVNNYNAWMMMGKKASALTSSDLGKGGGWGVDIHPHGFRSLVMTMH